MSATDAPPTTTTYTVEPSARGWNVVATHPNGLRTVIGRSLPGYRAEQLAAQCRGES